uniref:Uncharacterized protein n=1 Tax=viral metagenome TaxID=1070528 RepID=A0A6H1ZVM7_9ZZZZ
MCPEPEDQLSELEGKLLLFLRFGPASLKELEEIDDRWLGALGKLKQKGLVKIENNPPKGKIAIPMRDWSE